MPFEFNHDKGSVVVGDNLLTQAVSSDGKTVFSTNSPQPIKKYQSTNINNNENSNSKKPKTQTTNPYYQNTNTQSNKQHSSKKPQGNREENFESTNGVYSTHMSPIDLNQWNFIEHISKYVQIMFGSFNLIQSLVQT